MEKVKENLNEKLDVLGIVATMHDSRTRHSNEILRILERDHKVLGIISESVKVKDSILASMSLENFDKSHKTAKEYQRVSNKIIKLIKE